MDWRVANSLNVLLYQIDDAYPDRSKDSDGSIGDARHQTEVSDHNPDPGGVVRARDFTNDPAHGFYARSFANRLQVAKDGRLKYVISEGQMFSSYATSAYPAWIWRPYIGINGHFKHVHVSVVADSSADDRTPWAGVVAGPSGRATPDYTEDDDPMAAFTYEQLVQAAADGAAAVMKHPGFSVPGLGAKSRDDAIFAAGYGQQAVDVDEAVIATSLAPLLAPLLIPQIVAALNTAGSGLTPEQIETALRQVFADAGTA